MHIVPFHHVQINILCKLSLPTLNVNIVELYQKSSSLKYILGVLNSGLGKVPVRLYVSRLQTRQFRVLSQFPKFSDSQDF